MSGRGLSLVLGLLCGAIVCAFWPAQQLHQLAAAAALLSFSLVTYWALGWRPLAALLLAFILGAALFALAVSQQQAQSLDPACEGRSLDADFTVQNLSERQGPLLRLWLVSQDPRLGDCFQDLPLKLRVSYWSGPLSQSGDSSVAYPAFKVGDQFEAEVKLRRPHSSLNPGGFDYRAWLWRQDVAATGYIKRIQSYEAATNTSARQRLNDRLVAVLGQHPALGTLQALGLGYRANISDQLWRQARETGLAHLLAISGLHLGLLTGFVFILLRFLSRRFVFEAGWPLLATVLPALLAATVYASLAAWPLSTQRAWLMLLLFAAAAVSNWRLPAFSAWGMALLVCLVWQPLNVLDAGFYLSFGAVACLLWYGAAQPPSSSGGIAGWKNTAILAFKMQLLLMLALLPMQLWWFGGFSVLALPLNLVALPLMAFLILPLLLFGCLLLLLDISAAGPILLALADGLALLQSWLAELQAQTEGHWYGWQRLGRPSGALMCLWLLAILFLALPRALLFRPLGLLLLLLGALTTSQQSATPKVDEFRLTVFDAGQGTAVLLQTQSLNLLYDTGPAWSSGSSAMQSMILPALQNMGIKRLDGVVISHSDKDHAGGLTAVLDYYAPTAVIGSDSQPCLAGSLWQQDGVSIRALWPLSGVNSGNDQSCVIKISSKHGTALLSGDIGRRVEERLLTMEADLSADWLLVPHHGSNSSSSLAFIKAVRPAVAVITSGHQNRYGLPAEQVLNRYRNNIDGIQLLNTAQLGAISTEFAADSRACTGYESERKHWWQ